MVEHQSGHTGPARDFVVIQIKQCVRIIHINTSVNTKKYSVKSVDAACISTVDLVLRKRNMHFLKRLEILLYAQYAPLVTF